MMVATSKAGQRGAEVWAKLQRVADLESMDTDAGVELEC